MAVFDFFMSRLTKRRERSQSEPPKPSKSMMSFLGKGRHSRGHSVSESEDLDEETQRAIMIRKSLASRASSRTNSHFSFMSRAPKRTSCTSSRADSRMSRVRFSEDQLRQGDNTTATNTTTTTTTTTIPTTTNNNNNSNSHKGSARNSDDGNGTRNGSQNSSPTSVPALGGSDDDQNDDEDTEEEEDDVPSNLKTDWKAYEAGLQRNRSVLIRTHPGIVRSSTTAPVSSLTRSRYALPRRPLPTKANTFSVAPRQTAT